MFKNQKKVKIPQNDSKILKLTPKMKIQQTEFFQKLLKKIEIHQKNRQSGTKMVKLTKKMKTL